MTAAELVRVFVTFWAHRHLVNALTKYAQLHQLEIRKGVTRKPRCLQTYDMQPVAYSNWKGRLFLVNQLAADEPKISSSLPIQMHHSYGKSSPAHSAMITTTLIRLPKLCRYTT